MFTNINSTHLKRLNHTNVLQFDKVDYKFCYLGDIAYTGHNSAVMTRVKSSREKFCEYLPILTGKAYSFKLKVYYYYYYYYR